MADATVINIRQSSVAFVTAYADELVAKTDPQGRGISQANRRVVAPWGNFVDNSIRDIQAEIASIVVDGDLSVDAAALVISPEGTERMRVTSSGASVTGDLSVSGAVDGHDMQLAYDAADGTPYGVLTAETSTGASRDVARLSSDTGLILGQGSGVSTFVRGDPTVSLQASAAVWACRSTNAFYPETAAGSSIGRSTNRVETVFATTIDASGNATVGGVVTPGSYTVATLPTASSYEGGLIYVSDESGGAVMAFSDGTNWRRMTDRAVVS